MSLKWFKKRIVFLFGLLFMTDFFLHNLFNFFYCMWHIFFSAISLCYLINLINLINEWIKCALGWIHLALLQSIYYEWIVLKDWSNQMISNFKIFFLSKINRLLYNEMKWIRNFLSTMFGALSWWRSSFVYS